MNDHVLNKITRETIHAIQKQIIIILHSKLEPVIEATKGSCYIDVLTNHQAWLPKLPTYSPLLPTERNSPDPSRALLLSSL